MPRPSRTASTMVAKLSSARIIFAASLVTSVPVTPMAIADVGGLQRRRVVDAVARHRDHVAVGLQRVDDAQLVHRGDARVDRGVAYRLGEGRVVERVDLGSGERGRPRARRCRGRRRCAPPCAGGRR